MMRLLPGTIRECSGAKRTSTDGASGAHPGDKVFTNGDTHVKADWQLLLTDSAGQASCHGYVYGMTPEFVRLYPTILIETPTTQVRTYARDWLSLQSNVFMTGFVDLYSMNSIFEAVVDAGEIIGDYYYRSGSTARFWMPSGAMVFPTTYNMVFEVFGMYNASGWSGGVYIMLLEMPLQGGKCNKHLPLFY
jgi:hypothetical protein